MRSSARQHFTCATQAVSRRNGVAARGCITRAAGSCRHAGRDWAVVFVPEPLHSRWPAPELIELNFTGAQTIYSNLGGQGGKPGLQPPDPAKQNIRLGPLGRMLDGTVIELLIENQTQCECSALMA